MRRRESKLSFKDRLAAAAVPIAIYGGIFLFTAYGFWDQVMQVESSSLTPKEDIIQATTVDAAEIEEMAEMLRQEEQLQEEEVLQEQERLEELKKETKEEEKRIEELKQQSREEEQKSLEIEKKRKEEEQKAAEQAEQREREQAERNRKEEAERKKRAEAAEKAEAEQLFGSYEGAIKRAVQDNFREPAGTSCAMRAVYNVNVAQNGTVQAVRLSRSSGSSDFDRAGEVAVTFASPLPIPENPKLYKYWKEFNFTFSPKGCL
ncbi:MAG: energy transducer TonB [Arenicellaceae bacterium]|nr:energy transducer TonB [Arenicellaceae bacterium]